MSGATTSLRRAAIRPLIFVVAVALLFVLAHDFGLTENLDPRWLREQILGLGPLGWLAFISTWVLLQPTGGPAVPVALAGGAVFGWLLGPALSLAGLILGSLLQYMLVRTLLRDAAERLAAKRFPRLRDKMRRRPTAWMLLLRTFWLLSSPVSIMSALTGIKSREFLLTLLATTPGMLLFGLLGDALYQFGWAAIPLGRYLAMGAVILLGVGGYGLLLWRRPALRVGGVGEGLVGAGI